jgi:hypothetical protein
MDSNDTASTRPVKFDEVMDDRKFNLPDAYDDKKIPGSVKRQQMGGAKRKLNIKTEEPDPADLESDAEYDPDAKVSTKRTRRSARNKTPKSYAEENDDPCDDDEPDDYAEDAAEVKDDMADNEVDDDYYDELEGNDEDFEDLDATVMGVYDVDEHSEASSWRARPFCSSSSNPE